MKVCHCAGLLETTRAHFFVALTEDDIILRDAWTVEIDGSVRSCRSLVHRCPCWRTSNVTPRQRGGYREVCGRWLGSYVWWLVLVAAYRRRYIHLVRNSGMGR